MANTTKQMPDRLPLFIVPGMPRAGTTFLYHNLQKHPQILLPYRKEIDFFNEIGHYRGRAWYHMLYRELQPFQIAGDLSPACWFSNKAIPYMKEYSNDIKIIIPVRDPAECAVSLYKQKTGSHYDFPKSLTAFIENGYQSKLTKKGDAVYYKFDNDHFIRTIESYKNNFGKNVLFYDYRVLDHNSLLVLKLIENFLSLTQWFSENNFDNIRINQSNRKNVKFFHYLSTKEIVRDFFEKLFPRKVTMKLRGYVDKVSVRSRSSECKTVGHSSEELAVVRSYLAESHRYYKLMFTRCRAFLGDGTTILNGSADTENKTRVMHAGQNNGLV